MKRSIKYLIILSILLVQAFGMFVDCKPAGAQEQNPTAAPIAEVVDGNTKTPPVGEFKKLEGGYAALAMWGCVAGAIVIGVGAAVGRSRRFFRVAVQLFAVAFALFLFLWIRLLISTQT